jgi:CRISPR-associated endoribonuclease Cas6
MRLLIALRARADARYNNAYHHKLRGRIWRGLRETPYDDLHDTGEPAGICFSNVFPWGDIERGDERSLLVSATERDVLGHIADDLADDREFNVGEMPFDVTDLSLLAPDVGEPGTRGTIETGTGVVVRIPPWKREEYEDDPPVDDTDESLFWRPEHTLEPFKQQIEANLDRKHDLFCPDHLPGPSDVGGDLFNEYELLKTYALPVTVTQGVEMTHVVSKWAFGYRVRDDHHRRHLNLALDTGIGERNALGFGFLNIKQESTVSAAESAQRAAAGGGR